MRTAPALLAAFSLLSLAACSDRLFDNPYDPDAETRAYEILSTLQTAIVPVDLTFSGDALWAVDSLSRVVALNHNSGALIREIEAPAAAAGIAYDGKDLWLSVRDSPQLVLVNIVNGARIRLLHLLRGSFGAIDYHAGRLYVADRLANAILVVDPENGTIERTIPQPGFAVDGLCHDGASLWVIDATQMKIFRLSESGAVERAYEAPTRTVAGLAFASGVFWCGDRTGKIFRLRFP
jgi:sugar lactone lactonase YvrE